MQKFKKGDKVKCVQPDRKLTKDTIYTIEGYGSKEEDLQDLVKLEELPYEQDINNLWFENRFELLEPVKQSPTFKIVEWKDWVNDTADRIEKAINDGNLSVFFVVTAPKLDKEDLNPFCNEYCCEGVYERNVFVKHHSEKNCYWYVTNDAKLIYNPKFN